VALTINLNAGVRAEKRHPCPENVSTYHVRLKR
jgi:hypothetical protein